MLVGALIRTFYKNANICALVVRTHCISIIYTTINIYIYKGSFGCIIIGLH